MKNKRKKEKQVPAECQVHHAEQHHRDQLAGLEDHPQGVAQVVQASRMNITQHASQERPSLGATL